MNARDMRNPLMQDRPGNAPADSPDSRAEISEFLGDSLNPLVQAATPLLLLAVQLRHSAQVPDLARLREQAELQVRRLETRLREARYPADVVMTARYVLCAVVDEAVLNAPWGERSGWAQRTLLTAFHGESYGGAKFFVILERLLQDPGRHLELLELLYLCLAMGFAGRYQIEADGSLRLSAIQDDLYRRIRSQRGAPPEELSPRWQGVAERTWRGRWHLPLWVSVAVAASVLLVAFLWANARLNALAAPINAEAARMGLQVSHVPNAAVQVPALGLKQRLAAEERAGLLSVDEAADGSARIRLNAAAMFSSGGIELEAAQRPLLAAIARAIDPLRGRVVVVGHTDDQPVRSALWKDNYVLSAARARAVADVLGAGLRDHARIETVGAGDSQPLATPPQLPANRARNRRVDILFQPGD
ncbi:type VI secretion system protein TssL [Stenotrophomonas maltophilia]|nr:type VI secretion system protein TssL [Stenotrophomonas maltophilia]PZP87428.1 MAG: type VI secretion system protein TssL [Stenotrophomonas maltophilia]